jgi:integrase/recombinase XerD
MYHNAWTDYANFAGSWEHAIQPETLARWRTNLVGTGKSPNTINRMLSSIRTVVQAAAEQGYITQEIAQAFDSVRGVKVAAMRDQLKANARTRISAEEMKRLCEAPDTSTLSGKMHKALLLTMASSGARVSEVITLRVTQIEERRQGDKIGYVILISGKTDVGQREAPLSVTAYTAITEWLQARSAAQVESDYIFTGFGGRGSRAPRSNHIHPVSAWELVKRYASAVGLTDIKPHDFRRFVGTSLAKRDPRQAQKALGHKDINTTFKHYVLDELEVGLTDELF